MHPAIRVLCLAALASALPALGFTDLALLTLAVLGLHGAVARDALRVLGRGLLRLRWLLLAIAITYWGFTPGEPLVEALPGLSREGAIEGARRALVLVALLTAVYLLLALTPLDELLLALRFLAAPLRLVGLSPQRFALRLSLTLRAAADAQARLDEVRRTTGGPVLERVTRLIAELEAAADRPGTAVALAPLRWPAAWEWPLPLLIGIGLHGLGT